MELRTGDIVIFENDYLGAYDAGIIDMADNTPKVIRFLPFKGKVVKPFNEMNPFQQVYRFIGRKDYQMSDLSISGTAVWWIRKWSGYRFSTSFWIFLSRIPLLRRLIKFSNDKSKVRADYGFTGATAVGWGYECAGVDLIPNQSPDLTSVRDLLRCPLFVRIF